MPIFFNLDDYIDLDAYGSMVGMSLFAKRLRTKSYLIINDKIVDNSIKEAIKITKKNVILLSNTSWPLLLLKRYILKKAVRRMKM
jgi:c-di-AMP phosphodiesterase-like protein